MQGTHDEAHLVTGATGLIGAALVLQLLTDTDRDVWCLIRPRGTQPAQHRLHQELTRAARLYGMDAIVDDLPRRCHALPGMLGGPLGRKAAGRLPPISHVWHSAATLRAEDVFADQVHRVNVDGTRHLLDFADLLGAEFNYVSTASVAPRRDGMQRENAPDVTSTLHNVYEHSKRDAELLVVDSGLPWRILRPVMVVGHSRTQAATTFSGLYAFVRQVRRYQRKTTDCAPDRRPSVVGAATAEVHFAPVDQVARIAARVGLDGSTGHFYHLANSRTPTVADVYATVFRWLGMPPPHCVDTDAPLDAFDRELNTYLAGFTDYFSRQEHFDCTRTQAVVGPEAMSEPMDSDTITALLDWYSRHTARGKGAT